MRMIPAVALLWAVVIISTSPLVRAEEVEVIEPPVIVAHSIAPMRVDGSRLSLSCAAFGSPTPNITWSSPAQGISDYELDAATNDAINIYTEEVTDATGNVYVISILELCAADSNMFTAYSCTASNGIEIAEEGFGDASATFGIIPIVQITSVAYTQRQLTAELRISFSGPVNIEQVGCDLRQLTFLDGFVPTTNFTPIYPGSCEQVTEAIITATLDTQDYITLLGLGAALFSSSDSAFLEWNSQLIGPQLNLVEPGEALQVTAFIPQTAALEVVGFDIDFNDEFMAVYFSSLVTVSSFNVTAVTLSTENSGGVTYTLVDSAVSTDTSLAAIICIALGSSDLTTIKNLGLCTSPSNCLATFDEDAAFDFAGNPAMVAMNLPVSVLREEIVFPRPSVYIVLTVETVGCIQEVHVYLTGGETHIIRESERVTRIDCFTSEDHVNPTLSWDQGGLPLNTQAPDSSVFIRDWPNHTYAEFPDGIPIHNYGLYMCTSERGAYVQHYIHNINPFVGVPLGNMLLPEFYYPISYPIRVAAIPQLSDGDIVVTVQPDGHTPSVNPVIDTYSHGATISYDNALNSLNGAYIITVNVSGPAPFSETIYLNISVLDPIVTIVPPVIVIRSDDTESLINVTCNPSHPDLPIRWLEGVEEIINDTAEFTLYPPNLNHMLTIDLSSGIELGDMQFSCILDDPEDIEEVAAADMAMVRTVPNDITVLRDGTEVLEDNTFLSNRQAQGDLRLECFSTQDNYNLVWIVNSTFNGPPQPEISIELNVNKATLTVNQYGMFEGTFRCVSLDSGLAVNIQLSGGEFCPVDVDPIWNIAWDRTLVGFSDVQPCPEINDRPTRGSAYRSCNDDGIWSETVNISQCISEEFAQIADMADSVFNGASPPKEEDVVELTEVLANATSTTEGVPLLPLDLNVANNIAGDAVDYFRENIATSTSLNTELVGVFNNVLSENNLDSWRQLQQISVGSQQLLQNMEDYGAYLAEAVSGTLVSEDNFTLETDNIIFQAQKISSGMEVTDIVFPSTDNVISREAQIRLPASLLIARGTNAAVNALFKNIAEILPIMNMDTRAVTLVLSSQLISSPSISPSTEEQEVVPVELTFTTAAVEGSIAPRCVFWNFSIPVYGAWDTDRLNTINTTDRGDGSFDIRCTSAHLTSFAVLVDISADQEFFTLPVYIGCGILLLCSALVILILTVILLLSCMKDIYIGIHYFVHLSLAFALLCAYITILAGLTRATENRVGCVAVAALLQYFFTASFSWLLCEAIILSVMLVVADFQRISKVWWLMLFIFGWGLPAISTGVSVGLLRDDYGTNAFCWISLEEGVSSRVLWAFVSPKLAFILVTAIILMTSFGCICKFFRVELKDGSKRTVFFRAWILLCGTVFLVLLLSAAWVLALLLVNDIKNVFAWSFMGLSTALGVAFVIITVIVVILDQTSAANTEGGMYRHRTSSISDKKPILSEDNNEANGLYELTENTGISTTPDAQKPENEYVSKMDASALPTQSGEEEAT